MLSILLFFLIFTGVALSVYQVYNIVYAQNFEDDERQTEAQSHLGQLSVQAQRYATTGESQGLLALADRLFDSRIDRHLVLSAASRSTASPYLAALLRRHRHLTPGGSLQVRHLSAWKTDPPARDSRVLLLSLILINCLVVMFLGGLSLYTVAYEVPTAALAWMNNAWLLMGLIYVVVAITHVLAKLDAYLHDLYLIGKLDA